MTDVSPMAASPDAANLPRMHGYDSATQTVRFGMALWPYDLLLRFGYDLPENEHTWEGEWFDDPFETAAFGLRSTGAKLVLALRAMDATVVALGDVLADGRATLPALKWAVQTAPLALDLVLGYLRQMQSDIAVVIPCCFGAEGRPLERGRRSLGRLAALPELAALDPELRELLAQPPSLAVRANRDDLYVISENAGFGAALPKSAVRTLRQSGAETLAAVPAVDEAVAAQCRWLDAVLVRLQAAVGSRAEDGEALLERWSGPSWAVLVAPRALDAALARRLPSV